jgi:hypothetical protein
MAGYRRRRGECGSRQEWGFRYALGLYAAASSGRILLARYLRRDTKVSGRRNRLVRRRQRSRDDVPALRAAAQRVSLLGYLIAGWLPFCIVLHAVLLREGTLEAFIAGPRFVPALIFTGGLSLMMAIVGYGAARSSRICAFIILVFIGP